MEHKKAAFDDVLPCYDDLSVWSLLLFVKNRRPIRSLINNGRKKVGSLKGVESGLLESMVGPDMTEVFIEVGKLLSRPPHDWVHEMWSEEIRSRRGSFMLKRSEGRSYKDIALEEGLSRQRITQMVDKFYAGQGPFLEIIEEDLMKAADYETELARRFPEERDRNIYLTWKGSSDGRKTQRSRAQKGRGN